MRIAVLTSLYPSDARPFEGLFAERRWRGMLERGHQLRVTHPLPYAPLSFLRPRWAEIAAIPRREERHGIEILHPRYVHVPRRAGANARAFAARGVETLLDGPRPDVVVADYAWPAAAAAEALKREGLPFVISGRGSDVLQVAGEAGLGEDLAAALRCAGHWCAVSRDLLQAMDRLGGAPGRGVLVANGVDGELFRCGAREAARRELGLPPGETGETVLLVVGHLIERKDPLLTLAVFERWLALGAVERARLVFVGRGPLEAALEAEIERLGLGARVDRLGELPPEQLATWYRAADALLLTSRREGRPNVVLEALASGLPVLATEAGGTAELLEAFPSCLARGREPAELAQALGRLLADPPPADELRASIAGLTWEAGLTALEGCLEAARREPGSVPG